MTLSTPKHKSTASAPLSNSLIYGSLVAGGLLLVDLVVTQSLWAIGLTIMGAIAIASIQWPQQFSCWRRKLSPFSRHYGLLKFALIAIAALWIVHTLSEPASAQFYQAAETWLTTDAFPDVDPGAVNMLKLAFNVLRALFLIYIGISIVNIVKSAQRDEDWQNLARTPLIIVIAVTAGDVLSTLIVSGTTTTTPTF